MSEYTIGEMRANTLADLKRRHDQLARVLTELVWAIEYTASDSDRLYEQCEEVDPETAKLYSFYSKQTSAWYGNMSDVLKRASNLLKEIEERKND